MATHVEKRVDAAGSVPDDEEGVAGHFITSVLSRLVELAGMGDQYP
jgi:hypothetical protein